MADWLFRNPYPDEKRREAVQGEFFTSDSIRTEAQALVREGIQNSLDAALDDAKGEPRKVSVRIYTSGGSRALPWKKAELYFGQAWPHFEAPENGVSEVGCPSRSEKCHFLLFEDFGTSGLIGDLQQISKPQKTKDNPFYFFMRAEGQSGKSEKDRGRWGLGKFVFPRASRIRSFLALTHRSDDDKIILCGQSILKWHKVEGREYNPDGWYGERDASSGVLMPVEDPDLINNFENDFGSRRAEGFGLSLLVPWCNPNIDHSLLVKSVLQEFYYPILDKKLEVTVESPESIVLLDYATFDDQFKAYETDLDSDTASIIDLARGAIESRGKFDFRFESPKHPPKWGNDLIPEDEKDQLSEKLKSGEPLSIRVPLSVYKKKNDRTSTEIRSYFSVWLRRDTTSTTGRPVFIRDGLIIPKAHSRLSRGYRALVLIQNKALSDLLGDAENPAHTRWDDQSEHFKGRYIGGDQTIRFVRNAVHEILRLVFSSEDGKDLGTLADLFPDSKPSQDPAEPLAKKTRRVKRPRLDISPAKPRIWRSDRIPGGFRVSGNPKWLGGAREVVVDVAYDVVRGNPLNKWRKEDFVLAEKPIETELSGDHAVLDSVRASDNHIRFKVNGSKFELSVEGFDINRDLYVRVRTEELEQ